MSLLVFNCEVVGSDSSSFKCKSKPSIFMQYTDMWLNILHVLCWTSVIWKLVCESFIRWYLNASMLYWEVFFHCETLVLQKCPLKVILVLVPKLIQLLVIAIISVWQCKSVTSLKNVNLLSTVPRCVMVRGTLGRWSRLSHFWWTKNEVTKMK